MKVNYISIWDGDRIETICDYNPETKVVSNIQSIEIANYYNTCEREFVELPDGMEIDIANLIISQTKQ